MKILRFISNNILFFISLFLLIFIPLYPKVPIVDVQHTWVYIRLEDFAVGLAIVSWIILFLFKKVTLKTPLTLPIMLFWIIGGISTLHGVLLLFPTLSDVFSNVALLSYLRRIEYMFLFFVAFWGMKDKKLIPYVPLVLTITLFLVAGYGFGQKFLEFPAFLTGNEEFAKGIPLRISALGRVPSTFAGHYDLAAYLVLVIPILVSIFFGIRNLILRVILLTIVSMGLVLLFMTVSRISFIVLLFSLVMLLIFQKKRLAIISLFVFIFIFLVLSPSLLQRFNSTVSEVDVLVNAKTGSAIGHVREVPSSYFKDKIVVRQSVSDENKKITSSSAIFDSKDIPPQAEFIVEANSPNGENLPQGTGYINLSLSPIIRKANIYFYEKSKEDKAKELGDATVFFGDFVVKKAKAYDISFTTRFQGEWPKTILAFERNIFFGSGYGSVSLAVDNDYLRLLGESGIIGFLSFLLIFLVSAIYAKKILPKIDSQLTRSFILGFIAGTFGLALNAIFIDVFEASKIAFSYWLLTGIVLGILNIYKDQEIDLVKEVKRVMTSTYAIIVYIVLAIFTMLLGITGNYFVGDDFTWLRWVSDCANCKPLPTIVQYFLQSNGFFYRPGTKLYFYIMQNLFWLNQVMYHFVSIFLHLIVVILVFLISKKILKNFSLSVLTAFLFLILSSYIETVFWISSTGFLFNAVFALLSLLSFIYWKENKKVIYFFISLGSVILSLLFHELGIVVPFLIILYDSIYGEKIIFKTLLKKAYYLFFLFPILPYLILRFIAKSHWLSGDYSYSFVKLPFNFIGNIIGYIMLTLFGPLSLAFYEKLRMFSKGHIAIFLVVSIFLFFIFIAVYRLIKKINPEERKIVIFGFLFFVISLLPFLGLGNISSRYSYLSSVGIMIIFVFFLKKTYNYLLDNGKYIAISSIALIIIIFSALHLFQLQKIQSDWKNAGEKSKNFLASLNYLYAHYAIGDTEQLYLVDVPIRSGDAWVFPVGLADATWLVFRNDNIKIHQVSSAEQAFNMIGTIGGRVFKFDSNGGLFEMRKTKTGEIVPVD